MSTDIPRPSSASPSALTTNHSRYFTLTDGPVIGDQQAHGLVLLWEGWELTHATLMARPAGDRWQRLTQEHVPTDELPGWIAELAEAFAPRIGVLVDRDPDGETSVQVYEGSRVLGHPVAVCPVVDPGAGEPTLVEWRETRDGEATRALAVSQAFADAVHDQYESWVDSRWVAGDDEGVLAQWKAAGHHEFTEGCCGDAPTHWVHDAPPCGCGGKHWSCPGPDDDPPCGAVVHGVVCGWPAGHRGAHQ